MSTVDVSGNIGSLLSFYKHERHIYGRCPNCQKAFRLSEVKLTYGKEPPRDLLTRMKKDDGASYPQQAIADKVKDAVTVDLVLELDATGAVKDVIIDKPTAIASSSAQYSPIRPAVISRDGAAISTASAVAVQNR